MTLVAALFTLMFTFLYFALQKCFGEVLQISLRELLHIFVRSFDGDAVGDAAALSWQT